MEENEHTKRWQAAQQVIERRRADLEDIRCTVFSHEYEVFVNGEWQPTTVAEVKIAGEISFTFTSGLVITGLDNIRARLRVLRTIQQGEVKL